MFHRLQNHDFDVHIRLKICILHEIIDALRSYRYFSSNSFEDLVDILLCVIHEFKINTNIYFRGIRWYEKFLPEYWLSHRNDEYPPNFQQMIEEMQNTMYPDSDMRLISKMRKTKETKFSGRSRFRVAPTIHEFISDDEISRRFCVLVDLIRPQTIQRVRLLCVVFGLISLNLPTLVMDIISEYYCPELEESRPFFRWKIIKFIRDEFNKQ